MDYKPLNNHGGYHHEETRTAPQDFVKPAPIPPGPVITNDVVEALAGIAGILRLGVHTIQQLVDLHNPALDPGLIWEGRIHYLVCDDFIRDKEVNPCDVCSLKHFCAQLQDRAHDDHQICDELMGEGGYHFQMLDVKLPD